jgi:DNA-binding Lrp family transcriptional regulator
MTENAILDDTNKQIITELQRNGRIELMKLAERINLSHPAASNRLKKLVKEGFVKVTAELNIRKLNMHLAILGIELDSLDTATKFVQKFRGCPRAVLITPTTGHYNLIMILTGEDFGSLQGIIERTIRPSHGVKHMSISFTSAPFEPEYLSVPIPAKKSDVTPCGKRCGKCQSYIDGVCVGCPAFVGYRGRL